MYCRHCSRIRPNMPRRSLIRSKFYPYHVTARCNNREKFYAPLEKVWNICSSVCHQITWLYGASIHAFVVMPNHIHMLISTPQEDLGVVMKYWMQETTRKINSASARNGHVYGGPYYWAIIQSNIYFETAFKYLYRNPVRGKLCNSVHEYAFSSLHGLLGQSALNFPLAFPAFWTPVKDLHADPQRLIDWLNQPFALEREMQWKKCLLEGIIGGENGAVPKGSWKRKLVELNELASLETYAQDSP